MESTVGRFIFQKRNEKIDWRKLASVDVDRIAREIDVDAIQDNILNVTYCNIQHELGHDGLDPNFIKLFRLSQLTVEYLLHCQEYLQQCMRENENKNLIGEQQTQQLLTDHEVTKAELQKRNELYKNLKKELQKAKKLIGDYQLMIRAGASGLHKCTCCSKSFVSEYYLRSHLERRHAEEAKKLRPLQVNYQSTLNKSHHDVELHNDLNEIKSRLKSTENELREERERISDLRLKETERNEELLQNFKNEHENWKISEQERMKFEMESYKTLMMSELKQTQAEKDILQQDEENSIIHEDLKQKIEELEVKFLRLQEKYQKDMKAMEIVNRKKVEKINEKLMKSEQLRLEDKKRYEEKLNTMQQTLDEHEKIIERSMIVDQVDGTFNRTPSFKTETSLRPHTNQTPLRPPEPPPRDTVLSTPVTTNKLQEKAVEPSPVAADLPEKDSICLWVAVNQSINHTHRVFRTPASSKSDWKDMFSFNALSQPIGEFQKPIYVYSCAGSPYWRQYVSDSQNPPASNYKHDFTFFTSTVKLLGTIKLYVHEGGSGTVVRSTISKEQQLEGWKHKGLSFCAMKTGPTKGLVSRSGTFNSDIFESISDDDDVSISSFTGTEAVKQDLAEALKRSREDLVNAKDDEIEDEPDGKILNQDKEKYDHDEEESDEGEEEEIGNEEKFGGTSSGSLLLSTLPEKGEFYPFPNNTLAVARYNHSKEMIMAHRQEVFEVLEDNLEKRGVDPDETQMTTSIFKSKMKNHDKEEQLKDKQFVGFSKQRNKIRQDLNNFYESMRAKKKKASKGLSTAVGVMKTAIKFKEKGKENHRPLPIIDDNLREDQVIANTKPTISHLNDNDGDDNDDGDDDDEFEVSDSSEWDSGDDARATPNIPTAPTPEPFPESSDDEEYEREEPYRPKMRLPQGEKVKELTASLEASLSMRDPNRKLAGAVDLHQVDNEANKPKRSVSFRDSKLYEDDDDDESDFSATSDHELRNKIPLSKSGQHPFDYEDDDEIDNLIASYETSTKAGKNLARPSASSTPFTGGSRPATNKPDSKETAVTEFNIDDFDDDSF